MRPIGFSTGVLYWSDLSLPEKLRLFKAAGATAVELNMPEQELLSLEPSAELIALLNSFQFVSLHAPDNLHGQSLQQFIAKMKKWCESVHFSAITIHPDAETDFAFLEKTSLPIAVENMDTKKQIVTDAAFFSSLSKYRLAAVLDVQHCYEHDNTMELAKSLANAMAGRLSHLHVSGQSNGNNHAPLFSAENSKAILAALKTLPQVPIILEGTLPDYPISDALQKELACLKP